MAVAVVPRNASCPCGSGRKHKLCCGTTREQEREAERRDSALLAATRLPEAFPLLRPDCKKFDAWAAVVLERGAEIADQLPRWAIEAGIQALGRGERERIARWALETSPRAWTALREDADEDELVTVLLAASVMLGLIERLHPFRPESVGLLEDDPEARADPVEALALVLEPADLWCLSEATSLDLALELLPEDLDDDLAEELWHRTVAEVATSLATARHRARLARLVGYVRFHLPAAGFPEASGALASACAAFEADRVVRARLAALLLEDLL